VGFENINKMNITEEENKVRALYNAWIFGWNNQDAEAMLNLLDDEINMVGFDGSQMNGKQEIGDTFKQIFHDHVTARYVTIIREVRFLSKEVALLRSVVGMVPRGHIDINPNVNAIQSLIAVKKDGEWKITLFQNTPAALHGQPELSAALSKELREKIAKAN